MSPNLANSLQTKRKGVVNRCACTRESIWPNGHAEIGHIHLHFKPTRLSFVTPYITHSTHALASSLSICCQGDTEQTNWFSLKRVECFWEKLHGLRLDQGFPLYVLPSAIQFTARVNDMQLTRCLPLINRWLLCTCWSWLNRRTHIYKWWIKAQLAIIWATSTMSCMELSVAIQ